MLSSKKHFLKSLRPPRLKAGAEHALAAPDALSSPNKVTVMGYGINGFEEIEVTDMSILPAYAEKWPVVWVDVDGLGNADIIIAIGKALGIDRLVLEDIFDVTHQPKIELFDKYVFMLLKAVMPQAELETEQVSLVLMEKFVLTFQEKPGDSFPLLRQQIRQGVGKARQFGSDYLAYALVDVVIESYYPLLTTTRQKLDAIEDTFISEGGMNVIRQIHSMKNDLLVLHSIAWPIRDITLALSRDNVPVVSKATAHYLRDCQDQANRVIQISEFYRLIASDLMNTYLAFNDYKANQVMKVLTMISAIFIPLSFIASIYGMNFDPSSSSLSMPELNWKYGYPTVLFFMLTVALGMLFWFKRLGWIGRKLPLSNDHK